MGNSDRVQWDPGRKLEEGDKRDPLKDKLKEQPEKQGMRTESERKEVSSRRTCPAVPGQQAGQGSWR